MVKSVSLQHPPFPRYRRSKTRQACAPDWTPFPNGATWRLQTNVILKRTTPRNFSTPRKVRDATRRAPPRRQKSHFRFALKRHMHLQDASTSTPTESHVDRTPFELRVAISAKSEETNFSSSSQQNLKDLRAANVTPLRLPAEGGRLRRHHSACDQVIMVNTSSLR